MVLTLLIQMVTLPPARSPSRWRLRIPGENSWWEGRHVFTMFEKHQQELFDVAGETLDSFTEMVDTMTGLMYIHAPPRQSYRLSPKNRLLLVLMWLRSHPCYSVLALLFDVSPGTICYEINRIWSLLKEIYSPFVE